MRTRSVALLSAILVLTSTFGLSADVKSQQKTQIKLEGVLGSVAGMFGGKAMKEGTVTTIAVKGNRRMSTTDTSAELVDLDAEKVYRLDLRAKTYTVKTFDEMRAEFQKAMAKGKQEASREKSDAKQPEMEFNVDIKKTGEKRLVAGASCDQVIMTLTVHEKGKTVEDAGGMILTSDMWMAPKVPALQEHMAFEMKYFQKLYGDQAVPAARDLAQVMATYPGMKDAMARIQSEGQRLDGTPMLTTMTVAGASGPGGSDTRANKDSGGGSPIGGALGGLLGRKKKPEPAAEGTAGAPGAKTRTTILTTVTEVLSIETAVAAGDVEIPAGFKQR
ncbi:MAG: hypothetical protein NTV05_16995 [Acidobacteria bacterium]|nr:hypothetical protein [Acidobacteriota bacterium]